MRSGSCAWITSFLGSTTIPTAQARRDKVASVLGVQEDAQKPKNYSSGIAGLEFWVTPRWSRSTLQPSPSIYLDRVVDRIELYPVSRIYFGIYGIRQRETLYN